MMGTRTNPLVNDVLRYLETNSEKGVQIRKSASSGATCLQFVERKFIPVSVLTNYFQDKTNITNLLHSIYGPHTEPPIDAMLIWHHLLKVFCILLIIGKPDYIHHFASQDKFRNNQPPFDITLDFPLDDEPSRAAFEAEQWRFCAHHFESYDLHVRIDDRTILPIVSADVLKGGRGVTITKIEIHPDYDSLRDSDGDSKSSHTYVLKSSPVDDARRGECHKAEIGAFSILRNSHGQSPPEIIGFFGGFYQNRIANIVLEFANGGTLEDYFETVPPPVTHEEQLDFWNAMKDLVPGLQKLHYVVPGADRPGVNQGYHQDVKPSNILVFRNEASKYKYRFKIADLGTSHFLHPEQYNPSASGPGQPAVKTYGSPESYRAQTIGGYRMINGQASDVWSIACIFSVANTWVVGGRDLVTAYAKERLQARQDLNISLMDSFHDDYRLLDVVSKWHRKLVGLARKNDDFTVRLWPSLLEPALHQDTSVRSSAHQFQAAAIGLVARNNGWVGATTRAAAGGLLVHDELRWEDLVSHEKKSYVTYQSRDFRQTTIRSSIYHDALGGYPPNPVPSRVLSGFEYSDEPQPIHHQPGYSHSSSNHHQSRPPSGAIFTPGQGFRQSTDNYAAFVQPSETPSSPHGSMTQFTPGERLLNHGTGRFENSNDVNVVAGPSHRPALSTIASGSNLSSLDPRPKETSNKHYPHCPMGKEQRSNRALPHVTVDELAARGGKTRDDASKEAVMDREVVFLVDDSRTMLENHWDEALKVFKVLANFLDETDDDGMELCFTVKSSKNAKGRATKLISALNMRDRKGGVPSDPTKALSDILNDPRKKKLRETRSKFSLSARGRQHKPGKPLSIVVLTDAIWQEYTDLATVIVDIVEFLDKEPKLDRYHVGLQFIRFGSDEAGKVKLDALDNLHESLKLSRDIVDTVPSTGNVWKMVLGPTNKSFDKEGEAQCTCGLAENLKG